MIRIIKFVLVVALSWGFAGGNLTAMEIDLSKIPDSNWGEAVDGLQAAVTGPKEVRYNDRSKFFLVIRNVSDRSITTTLLNQAYHPNLTAEGKPIGVGGYSNHQEFTRYQIEPKKYIAIPFPEITIVRGKVLKPAHAKRDLKPGRYFIATTISAAGEKWGRFNSDEPVKKITYAEGDWRGYLKTNGCGFQLLDEDSKLDIPPPFAFTDPAHLQPSFDQPKGLDYHNFNFELSPNLNLQFNSAANEHWIGEHGNYNRTLYWGPFTAEALQQLNVLKTVETQIESRLAGGADKASPALWEMNQLAQLQKPIVEMVFRLIPKIRSEDEDQIVNNGFDFLGRSIRDRRLELYEMGLKEETQTALETLSRNLPDLPPETTFQTIGVDQNPADAPVEQTQWGPENNGLRAAAIMPAEIKRGQTVEVRHFIKNVSDAAIFLTVSDRSGYDTASAVDSKGAIIDIENELIYPSAFSSVIHSETDPGLATQKPATANLIRLKLEPKAIWELETKAKLHHFESDESHPRKEAKFIGRRNKNNDAIATIKVKNTTEALVTWELHTANGAEYSEDLKSRIWPAKGGWSGLLHTAPTEVKLVVNE